MKTLERLYRQFKMSMMNARQVMGMNRRNLEYVYPNNPRRAFAYANDKVLTKETLHHAGLSIPETYMLVRYFYELQALEQRLRGLSSFVIKPAAGSGGNGILVIARYAEGQWYSIGGSSYSYENLKKHIVDIIFGVFSFGLNDTAIIEERVVQDESVSVLSSMGLADIRMINYKGVNVKAMLRIATEASEGKANLHQGGVGVAIDLESGRSFSAQRERENISHHPDTGVALLDVKIPYWEELLELCEATASVIPLGYLGIDVALSEKGPVVLEVNARPGIEIQNISSEGMLEALAGVEEMQR